MENGRGWKPREINGTGDGKWPRIKSSRKERDGRWKMAEDGILGKRTGQEWKRDTEDKILEKQTGRERGERMLRIESS